VQIGAFELLILLVKITCYCCISEWIDAENVEDPPALPDIFTASPPSPSPGPSNPLSGVPSPTPTPDPRPLPPVVSPSTSQPREGKKRKLSTDRKKCYANTNSRQEELHKAQLGLTEETQHQLRETCSAVREAAREAQHAFASIANDSKRVADGDVSFLKEARTPMKDNFEEKEYIVMITKSHF